MKMGTVELVEKRVPTVIKPMGSNRLYVTPKENQSGYSSYVQYTLILIKTEEDGQKYQRVGAALCTQNGYTGEAFDWGFREDFDSKSPWGGVESTWKTLLVV